MKKFEPTYPVSLSEQTSALGRNFLWMVGSGLVSIANSVLVWIFLARSRDVDEVGKFTVIMGLYALFFSVVSLGLIPYLVNEISRRIEIREDGPSKVIEFISTASVLLFLSGSIAALAMSASGFLISESWTVRISTLVLSLSMIPTGLLSAAEAAAISFGRTRLVAGAATVENILRTVIPIGLIWAGFDTISVCISFAAVRFVALAVYYVPARSYLPKFVFNPAEFRKILGVCPTFAGTIVFASINWQMPIILLGYLSTDIEDAKYGVASRFLVPVSILMASYASVVQPSVARQFELARRDFGSFLSQKAHVPLILAALAAVGSPLLSPGVLATFFGSGYESAASTLDILAVSVIPFCLIIISARGLIAAGAPHIDLLANILGVAVCVGTGMVLIPRYGAVGAAAAQLFSFVSMAVVEIIYLSRKVEGFTIWRTASLSSVGLLAIYLVLWNP